MSLIIRRGYLIMTPLGTFDRLNQEIGLKYGERYLRLDGANITEEEFMAMFKLFCKGITVKEYYYAFLRRLNLDQATAWNSFDHSIAICIEDLTAKVKVHLLEFYGADGLELDDNFDYVIKLKSDDKDLMFKQSIIGESPQAVFDRYEKLRDMVKSL